MAISFSVNCERAVLFPVKCDLDPPFTTLNKWSNKNILELNWFLGVIYLTSYWWSVQFQGRLLSRIFLVWGRSSEWPKFPGVL